MGVAGLLELKNLSQKCQVYKVTCPNVEFFVSHCSMGSVCFMEPTNFSKELLEPTEFEGKWDEKFEQQLEPFLHENGFHKVSKDRLKIQG